MKKKLYSIAATCYCCSQIDIIEEWRYLAPDCNCTPDNTQFELYMWDIQSKNVSKQDKDYSL